MRIFRCVQINLILQVNRVFTAAICAALMLVCLQCAKVPTPTQTGLPQDVLGVSVGMTKEDAEKRLKDIANFDRAERKSQQIWILKDNPNFSHLAVGYDKQDKIRYASAIASDPKNKKLLRFTEIGDIKQAKPELVPPHHRYIWETSSENPQNAQIILAYGDNPDFLSFFSISRKVSPEDGEEEGKETEKK